MHVNGLWQPCDLTTKPDLQDRHLIVSCMPHFTKSFMPLKWAAKSCKRGHGKDICNDFVLDMIAIVCELRSLSSMSGIYLNTEAQNLHNAKAMRLKKSSDLFESKSLAVALHQSHGCTKTSNHLGQRMLASDSILHHLTNHYLLQ